MTTEYAADISYYQPQVDNSYTRKWLIVRCCDGAYLDPNAVGNADWCRGAVAQGLMRGWTAYVVYRPGMNADILGHLSQIAPLGYVMIDVEVWQGQIRGDHSDEINSLADSISHIVGQDHVWIYGNQGDLAEIAPRRRNWLGVVIAGYGSTQPSLAGPGRLVGWQYTNGQYASGDRPLSSAPFGACDHNEIYLDQLSPSGGGDPIGADMPLTPDDLTAMNGVFINALRSPEFETVILEKVWDAIIVIPDGGGQDTAKGLMTAFRQLLGDIENKVTAQVALVAKIDALTAAVAAIQPGTPAAPAHYTISGTLTGKADPA